MKRVNHFVLMAGLTVAVAACSMDTDVAGPPPISRAAKRPAAPAMVGPVKHNVQQSPKSTDAKAGRVERKSRYAMAAS